MPCRRDLKARSRSFFSHQKRIQDFPLTVEVIRDSQVLVRLLLHHTPFLDKVVLARKYVVRPPVRGIFKFGMLNSVCTRV